MAYVNFISVDRNFVPQTDVSLTNFVRIIEAAKESGANGGNGLHERLYAEVTVKQAGYMYIYLSNDNPTVAEVYFDDFKVKQVKSPVIQTGDYYPFGLNINSYQRENSAPNQYQFNGKELQDESGLDWLDYGARMYMPEIGRWGVEDNMVEKYLSSSPYNYTLNNPILLSDPDGNDISVSNLSESQQKSLLTFAKTNEGRQFLSQFAVGGKEYTIGGEKIVYEKSGKFLNQQLNYITTPKMSGADAKTVARIWNPKKGKWIDLRELNVADVKASARSEGNKFLFAMNVYIGDDQQGNDATYYIGHENFLHVQRMSGEIDGAINDYKSGELAKRGQTGYKASAENVMTGLLQGTYNADLDHKLFVNGKNVSIESFVKSLDKLFGGNSFSELLKKDKKNSR